MAPEREIGIEREIGVGLRLFQIEDDEAYANPSSNIIHNIVSDLHEKIRLAARRGK